MLTLATYTFRIRHSVTLKEYQVDVAIQGDSPDAVIDGLVVPSETALPVGGGQVQLTIVEKTTNDPPAVA